MLEVKMHLEELQMENEYQLRLKDMNYNEKMKEISDKFSQQIESLNDTQQVCQLKQNSIDVDVQFKASTRTHSLNISVIMYHYVL